MYVNDGVCDWEVCCDGSEEFGGVGGVKCEDRCGEIGKEWRKLEEVKMKARREAGRKREGLLKEAGELRAGVELSIVRLGSEIRVLEQKAEDLKRRYEEVERRERGKVVMGSKEGKGSKVTVLAGLAKRRVEELRDALVGTIQERETLKGRVQDLEAILKTFKEEYNPNFNDEGVKRAVKAWEDYAANKGEEVQDREREQDVQEVVKEDSETEGINWAEWEVEEEESDVDARKSSFSSFLEICHEANWNPSLQIRRIPPYSRPRLGSPQTRRPPRPPRRERHTRRQRQLRQRIESRN